MSQNRPPTPAHHRRPCSPCATPRRPSVPWSPWPTARSSFDAGEIHALVGENGAGKSTLVKILAGLYHPDAGEFTVDGQPVAFRTVADSKAAGISVIYQEPTLFPDLTVAENIFIGRQPKGRAGLISRARDAHRGARAVRPARRPDRSRPHRRGPLDRRPADHRDREGDLARREGAHHGRTDRGALRVEVERLFAVARGLRDGGAGILFISHRFDEIFALADRITVMRDGRYIATHDTAAVTTPVIVREMVGRDIAQLFPKVEAEIGDAVLTVAGLSSAGVFSDIDFEVRSGEIVALAGLVGAGRTEVARAVFGIDGYDRGSVELLGRPLRPRDPQAAIDAGIGFVPEDRRKQGLVMDLSVARNATLTLRNSLARFGLINGAPRTRRRRGVDEAPPGEDGLAGVRGRDPLGRQPAEGRPRQVARHRAEAPHRRRAHPRHRRGHEGRGAPTPLRPRGARHRDPDDLVGASRGARHGRPGPRHARRPNHRPARSRGCHT